MIIDSKEKLAEPPTYDTVVPRIPPPPPPIPQTYTFSQWAQNSMFLLGPPSSSSSSSENSYSDISQSLHSLSLYDDDELRRQRMPLYRITVDLDLNPFLPTSYVTRVFRCRLGGTGGDGGGESDLVGEFAISLNNKRAVIRLGDTATRLSSALYSVNSNPRHFNWILKTKLHWDCREIMKDGSPKCICYLPTESTTPLPHSLQNLQTQNPLSYPQHNTNANVNTHNTQTNHLHPSPNSHTHTHPHSHSQHNSRSHNHPHARGLHASRSSPYLSGQAHAYSNSYSSNQSSYSSHSNSSSYSSYSSRSSDTSRSGGAHAHAHPHPSSPANEGNNNSNHNHSNSNTPRDRDGPWERERNSPRDAPKQGEREEKQYHGLTVAIFVPPPPDRSPPLPDATLTVFPYGHQLMDEIVMSALVVERMLVR